MSNMTDAERAEAIRRILAECPNINSDLLIVNTIHALHFTVAEIGCSALLWAIDEARAQQKRQEAA